MFRLVRGKASIWPMDDSLVVAVEALASDGIKGHVTAQLPLGWTFFNIGLRTG